MQIKLCEGGVDGKKVYRCVNIPKHWLPEIREIKEGSQCSLDLWEVLTLNAV